MGRGDEAWGVPLKCGHRPAILCLPLTPRTRACSFLSSLPGFLSAAFQNVFAETAFFTVQAFGAFRSRSHSISLLKI